jgi:hypothetical protein
VGLRTCGVGERSLECANICVQCSAQYCTGVLREPMLVPCAGEPMLKIPLLAIIGLVPCAGEPMLVPCAGEPILKIPLLAIVGLVPCAGEPMIVPCAGEPMLKIPLLAIVGLVPCAGEPMQGNL